MSIPRRIRRRVPNLVLVQPLDSFPRLLNVWQPKTHKCPTCVSRGNLFGMYPFPDESAHVCQIWCQSVQPFDSFSRLLNLWPPKCPGVLKGKLYLAYVHSRTNPQTCTKFVANRSSRLVAFPESVLRLVRLLAAVRAVSRKNTPKDNIYTSKIIIPARTLPPQRH